jgi:hypothetical protein
MCHRGRTQNKTFFLATRRKISLSVVASTSRMHAFPKARCSEGETIESMWAGHKNGQEADSPSRTLSPLAAIAAPWLAALDRTVAAEIRAQVPKLLAIAAVPALAAPRSTVW